MTSAEQCQKHWNTLLKRLRHDFAGANHTPPTAAATLPDLLVHAMLLWEASTHQAELAHQRLRATFTDHNELRVSMPEDIALALGERYPLADERAMRLRAVLNDIFAKEHAVSLDRLRDMPKRDARQYLLSLEGCTDYAAAYVVLHGLAGHAVPIDERLIALLQKTGVVTPGTDAATASSWFEHHVHGEECASIHAVLRAWSDRDGHTPARETRATVFPTGDRPAATTTRTKDDSSAAKAKMPASTETPAKKEKAKTARGKRKT